MPRIIRDTYLGSVARPLLDRAYNWDDFYLPRTDRPVRFVWRGRGAFARGYYWESRVCVPSAFSRIA